jgi:predicted GNAT family acetyltransferase
MTIQQHDTTDKGYFTLEADGVEAGKLHYSWAGIGIIIISHTEVNKASEHQGNGLALVEASVKFARQGKIKIIPKCSFAKAMLKQHEEWQDVLWHG